MFPTCYPYYFQLLIKQICSMSSFFTPIIQNEIYKNVARGGIIRSDLVFQQM